MYPYLSVYILKKKKNILSSNAYIFRTIYGTFLDEKHVREKKRMSPLTASQEHLHSKRLGPYGTAPPAPAASKQKGEPKANRKPWSLEVREWDSWDYWRYLGKLQ